MPRAFGVSGGTQLDGAMSDAAVLPAQFYEHGAETPERALMHAVLERATLDLNPTRQLGDASHRAGVKRQQKTMDWFLSDDTSWTYSFLSICDTLGLSPSAIRREVLGSSSHASGTRRAA